MPRLAHRRYSVKPWWRNEWRMPLARNALVTKTRSLCNHSEQNSFSALSVSWQWPLTSRRHLMWRMISLLSFKSLLLYGWFVFLVAFRIFCFLGVLQGQYDMIRRGFIYVFHTGLHVLIHSDNSSFSLILGHSSTSFLFSFPEAPVGYTIGILPSMSHLFPIFYLCFSLSSAVGSFLGPLFRFTHSVCLFWHLKTAHCICKWWFHLRTVKRRSFFFLWTHSGTHGPHQRESIPNFPWICARAHPPGTDTALTSCRLLLDFMSMEACHSHSFEPCPLSF